MQLSQRLLTTNAAALYGIAAKILNGVMWLAVAVTVSTYLSKAIQGYFFTFLSLATVQMLFDLGLGTAIIQFSAHEWAAASSVPNTTETSSAASRLSSVMWFSVAWYMLGAVGLLIILTILGWYFFAGAPPGAWPGAWSLLSVTVSCDFALLAFWNVLEGCNQVRHVYAYRALKALVLGAVVLIALTNGCGLYSLGLGYLAILPISIGMLMGRTKALLTWIWNRPRHDVVDWWREIVPLQWRLAVSFGSGYFAQWGLTPITFKLFGPVVAGQFGMAWSIINAIIAVSNVIVFVRAPQFGILIAARKFAELDRLALRVSLLSVGIAGFACLAVGFSIYMLNITGSHYAERLLPLGPSLVMLAGTAIWQIVNPMAVYLRSHKQEPYLWLSFGFAVGLVALTYVGGKLWGEWGVTLGYFALVSCFFLPGAILIFQRCRGEWHVPLTG